MIQMEQNIKNLIKFCISSFFAYGATHHLLFSEFLWDRKISIIFLLISFLIFFFTLERINDLGLLLSNTKTKYKKLFDFQLISSLLLPIGIFISVFNSIFLNPGYKIIRVFDLGLGVFYSNILILVSTLIFAFIVEVIIHLRYSIYQETLKLFLFKRILFYLSFISITALLYFIFEYIVDSIAVATAFGFGSG